MLACACSKRRIAATRLDQTMLFEERQQHQPSYVMKQWSQQRLVYWNFTFNACSQIFLASRRKGKEAKTEGRPTTRGTVDQLVRILIAIVEWLDLKREKRQLFFFFFYLFDAIPSCQHGRLLRVMMSSRVWARELLLMTSQRGDPASRLFTTALFHYSSYLLFIATSVGTLIWALWGVFKITEDKSEINI